MWTMSNVIYIWDQSWISASLLQFSVSHDNSEIIQICWFDDWETFLIIINAETSRAAFFACMFYYRSKKNILIINVFTVTFDVFTVINNLMFITVKKKCISKMYANNI